MNRLVSSVAVIRPWRALVCAVALAALVGCAAPLHKAPVEDRAGARTAPVAPAAAPASADPARPPAGAENAGKPGYYTVKPGDTMIRIGLETGQNWRDIARWNAIENPNVLEVGQVLRVAPPGTDPAAPTTRGVIAGRAEPRPLDVRPGVGASAPASAPASVPVAAAATPREGDDDVAWAWPTATSVAVPFDETKSKGLVFAGKQGDPVLAAADGRVVYAGSGLRGYGNLVIVKHNGTYLSAYAHNQTLLVKEDQVVRRGQKIAEMGSSDAERVQLHFEIRRLGKPVDPTRLLPAR
ncbi:MAG TPA: peptidoglycan DD-metalloendopeptidase family protein [Burkholderiaceae bacterium]|nr:peptidoglycan DD-metalloendopeptidase family protein [Burkholderiaceae bacterium]